MYTYLLLLTGGILFVLALYMTQDGQYEEATKSERNIMQTMHTIWKHLYQEGRMIKVSSTCMLFALITHKKTRYEFQIGIIKIQFCYNLHIVTSTCFFYVTKALVESMIFQIQTCSIAYYKCNI